FFETGEAGTFNSFKSIFLGNTQSVNSIAIRSYKINRDIAILNLYKGGLGDSLYERVILTGPNKHYKITHQTFYLGTDGLGRDMLSRLILGNRISLSV